MSDRSDRSERKRVNFQTSPTPKASSRSSVRSRDSAIDYNEQRSNVRALQEALQSANEEVEELKKKLASVELVLDQSHKANREMKARCTALDNLGETMEQDKKELQVKITELKEQVSDLQNENAAQRDQIDEFKETIDDLRIEKADLQQHLDSLVDPVRDPVMSGAGKSSSSKALARTASKGKRDKPEHRSERPEPRGEHRSERRGEHRSERDERIERSERPSGSRAQKESQEKDMKDRLKDRLNRDSRPPVTETRRPTGRRMSIAGNSGRPYIEEPPTSPSSSNGSGHYILAHPDSVRSPGAYGATPRSRTSNTSSGYASNDRHESGNYVFHPLPDQRGGR
ncbi:uncharacterized protein B0I36DRAFT_3481 [Microdochium trichocladiopsis]|uniref:Uncharacterized protein n=1 Tax=Microdochium trichocladiopsis TaxID=1682393 RepID=A0A9P8YG66_9PEZI|nr:uncharacterized protein B0I36DRAFT_3481 [Microdochium trichocladiopsis]KAH7039921.1 hypothetical protein B0I36DRAFT_3481 [Microdochium trichocladiopsis]